MSVAAAVPIACHAASFDSGQRLVVFRATMTGGDGGVAKRSRGEQGACRTELATHRRNGADFETVARAAALLRE